VIIVHIISFNANCPKNYAVDFVCLKTDSAFCPINIFVDIYELNPKR